MAVVGRPHGRFRFERPRSRRVPRRIRPPLGPRIVLWPEPSRGWPRRAGGPRALGGRALRPGPPAGPRPPPTHVGGGPPPPPPRPPPGCIAAPARSPPG